MKEIHLVFDLDGTLVDSRYEIESTYKKVCKEIIPSKPVDFNALNYGATLPANLKFIYGDEEDKIALGRQKFIEIYDNSTFVDTTLYDSVKETIQKLYQEKYILHIATNKRLVPTLKLLKVKDLFPYFKGITTSDSKTEQIVSKQDMVKGLCREFDIKKGYMIGDGDLDIEAGHLNNLITVAALYGYEKKEVLLKKNPKFVIDRFTQLNTILSKNI